MPRQKGGAAGFPPGKRKREVLLETSAEPHTKEGGDGVKEKRTASKRQRLNKTVDTAAETGRPARPLGPAPVFDFETRSDEPAATLRLDGLVRLWKQTGLRSVLEALGPLVEGDAAIWTNPTRSIVLATFASTEGAAAARQAMDGKTWPEVGGKPLGATFSRVSAADGAEAWAAATASHKAALAAYEAATAEDAVDDDVGPGDSAEDTSPGAVASVSAASSGLDHGGVAHADAAAEGALAAEAAPTAPVGVLDLAGIPTVDADGRRLTGKERRRLLWLQRKEQRKLAAAEAAPAGLAASKPPILLKARRKAGDALAVATDVAAGTEGDEDALLPHSGAGAADVGVGVAANRSGLDTGVEREEEVYSEENGYYHTEAAPPLLYTTAPAGEIDARRQLKHDAEEGAAPGSASEGHSLEAGAPPLMESVAPLQHPPQHQPYGRGRYEGTAARDHHGRGRAGMEHGDHAEREAVGGYRPGLLPPPQLQQRAPGRGPFGTAPHHGSYGAARGAYEGRYGSAGGSGRRDEWEAAGAGGGAGDGGEPAHFDGAAGGPSGYRAPPQREADRPYAGGYADHGEGPSARAGGPDAWRGDRQQPHPARGHGDSERGLASGPGYGRDAPPYLHAGAGWSYRDDAGRSGYDFGRGAAGVAEEMRYRGASPSRDPYGGYAPGPAAGDRHRDGMPRDTPPSYYREEGPYGGPPEGYPRGYPHHGRGGLGGAGGYEQQYGQRSPGDGRPSEASGGGWAPPPYSYHPSGPAAGGAPEHRSGGYHGGGPGRYR